MRYRRKKISRGGRLNPNVWHYHGDCQNWPKKGYEWRETKPPIEMICGKCKAAEVREKPAARLVS